MTAEKLAIWRAFNACYQEVLKDKKQYAELKDNFMNSYIREGKKQEFKKTTADRLNSKVQAMENLLLGLQMLGRKWGKEQGYGAIYPEIDIDDHQREIEELEADRQLWQLQKAKEQEDTNK